MYKHGSRQAVHIYLTDEELRRFEEMCRVLMGTKSETGRRILMDAADRILM